MTRARRIDPLAVYCTALLVFLFAPVATMVLFSFDRVGSGVFPLTGFTTHWYSALWDSDAFRQATLHSLEVAVAAAAVSVTLGTLSAFALVRYPIRLGGAFLVLLLLPIALPGLLVGVSLLSFFSRLHITLSLLTVTVAHVLLTLPFVVLTMTTRLAAFDRSLEDAAGDLGATPVQTLRHVTLPLLRPSMIGSALLVAAISLDEFVVTFFTIGPQNTLPLVIWGQMRKGVSPTVNAISTLMLALTVLVVIVVRRVSDIRFR